MSSYLGTKQTGPDGNLADHVEQSVAAVAKFYGDHRSSATPLQKLINRATDGLGRPTFVVILLAIVALWMGATLLHRDGAIDQASFAWLELAATLVALLVAVLILVTQRHEDQLAERRAQLILELALLSDRKSAKIIALLEELRRDTPAVADRVDGESNDMQEAADPMTVLDALDRKKNEVS